MRANNKRSTRNNNYNNNIDLSPEEFLSDLEAGEHGCIFFSNKEEMQKIHFSYIQSGLKNNWGVVYVTAIDSIDIIRKSMQEFGIEPRKYENNGEGDGSLILLNGDQLYGNPEKPDIQMWKNSAKSISESFIANGKRGVRVAADLSSYFLSRGLLNQWHELEYTLEKRLSLPISILCAYDMNFPHLIESDILKYYEYVNRERKEFIEAHSFAIFLSKNKNIIMRV